MFLFALLPLVVFVIAEALFKKPVLSIALAMACTLIQLVYFYTATGKFDWSILLDAGLIVILGTISILAKNQLFFKLKPVFIDVACIIYLMVLYFSSDNFLLDYFNRMMTDTKQFSPAMMTILRPMLLLFSVNCFLHGAAVVYTALYSSRRIWLFVAGPGMIFLFIPAMIVVLLRDWTRFRKNGNARTIKAAPLPPGR